jgi:transposase
MDQHAKTRLNRSCPNDWKAIHRLVSPLGPVHSVAIEACTGAADLAQQLLDHTGWNVHLAHCAYVAKLKGSPDKTDFSDAQLLADLARVGYLPRVWLPPAYIRDLRQLVRYRQRLVDQRRNLKLQIGAILREQRVKFPIKLSRWTRPWIHFIRNTPQLSEHARWIVNQSLDEIQHLDQRVQQAEQRLRQSTQDDPVIQQLMTRPGIGEVTAWTFRAFIGRFDRFKTGKQLARYCGLSPKNASSGNRQADAGLINAANPLLRATIIQAAHRLVRTTDRWSTLYQQLVSRGKPACVAVAAVANRWIRRLHHEMN